MTMTMPTAQGTSAPAAPVPGGSSAKDNATTSTGFAAALTAAGAATPAAGRGPARDTDGVQAASVAPGDPDATPDATGAVSSQPSSSQPASSQPTDAGTLAALLGLPVAASPAAAAAPAARPSLAADSASLAVGDGPRVAEHEDGRAARVSAEPPATATATAVAGTATASIGGGTSAAAADRPTTPASATSTGATSTGVAPTGVAPTGVTSTHVAPTGVAPTGVASTGATSTGVAPTGVAPTGVAPGLATSDAARAAQAEDGRAARVPATAGSGTTPGAAAAPTHHEADAIVRTQAEPGLPGGPTTRTDTTFALPPSTAPTTAPAASTQPSAAPAAQPAPLAQQLARPVFTLAQAGPGDHVVTVQVVPDTLGPVTIRAHVTAHGMHVELFAASDAGRDAVRQVLPDLRRDAVASGVSTTLDLSSQNHPDRQTGESAGRDGRPSGGPPGDDLEARPAPARTLRSAAPSVRTAGLDVLA